jgi:hypothetical protein
MIMSKDEFIDIEKIVNYLKPYKLFLKDSYIWNTPSEAELFEAVEKNILNITQYNELISEKNIFERNVILKKILCEILCSEELIENRKKIFKWIVNKWGGINVRDENKLYGLVTGVLKQTPKANEWAFENIASVSKVLSFMAPEKYIIYDARVAYSINWILLKTNSSSVFFPMPESRNSKLNAIDISSLIRLNNVKQYSNKIGSKKIISNCDKEVFLDKSKAYSKLCNLINEINIQLWEDDKKIYPFYTEMLMFSLADTEIFADILTSCKLTIQP